MTETSLPTSQTTPEPALEQAETGQQAAGPRLPTSQREASGFDSGITLDKPTRLSLNAWLHVLLLGLVLLAGAALRLAGSDWGEYQYLHPDERFLIWVGADISPVQSLGDYFDTANSSLNPHNRGHNFYVYGTLPMFITRYVVEWVYGHSGFNEMTNVGRPLSALVDLLTLMLVYLIATRLFDRRVGLLATAFSAFAVLQIQQSHFFTMDTFINLFTLLAFYIAVQVAYPIASAEPDAGASEPARPGSSNWLQLLADPLLWLCAWFGIALGMAVASKLNAALMAAALPVALGLRLLRTPKTEWDRHLPRALVYLGLAAVLSVLVFRLAQPYAFSGPGFFGLTPNPKWVSNIKELAAQGAGDIDMPPSLQWARRPITYAWENMVKWGMGLPLGLLAWAGFLFAAWRMLRGDWQRHLLLWGWTAFYFAWWARAFNPTMRYFLPVYPTLAIFAAWVLIYFYDVYAMRSIAPANPVKTKRWLRWVPAIIGTLVLLATIAWAAAFTSIYTRPITRVEASRWIYQNIPGAITLLTTSGEQTSLQSLSIPYSNRIQPNAPYYTVFTPRQSGWLTEVQLPHVLDHQYADQTAYLSVVLSQGNDLLASNMLEVAASSPDAAYTLILPQSVNLVRGAQYSFTISDPVQYHQVDLCGSVFMELTIGEAIIEQVLPAPVACQVSATTPVTFDFVPDADSLLTQLRFSRVALQRVDTGEKTLTLRITTGDQSVELASASVTSRFEPMLNGSGAAYALRFDPPLAVETSQTYWLEFKLTGSGGALSLQGAALANEGDWDDGLPVRVDGYDAFGGIYQAGLNFNMYTDDNTEKLERFLRILNNADYILISSNRQWGSLPRLPERFPMSTLYYRELMGCPAEMSIFDCYAEAKPGMFQGRLGFDLLQVFQSDPQLGEWRINDQYAEEAFHVYEHPKVLIFQKRADFDLSLAQAALGSVNLNQVVHLTPKRAGSYPATLMLPADRLAEQQAGGTWSEIFDPQAWFNRHQLLGVILWYLALSLLGLLAYSTLRVALAGLPDRGYPLARTAGLLALAYLAWLAGSLRIPFERTTLTPIVLFLLAVGAVLAYFQRHALRQEWRDRKRYFLTIEALALLFFVAFLLVRLGNPDLWHPWKGGEKPMDFSYFNAILKSTSFPPYDPWLAEGYLNYYYFGFVLFGALVKWLGIIPSFAYNLILASAFSLVAMGAFSIAWNLASAHRTPTSADADRLSTSSHPYSAGVAGALSMVVLGNLGTLRMIWQGYQRLSDPALADPTLPASFFHRIAAGIDGFFKMAAGANLPYGIGDWYWIPSRLMPPGDDAITEFPAFTFTYADPHAHLYALPIALLSIAWAVSVVLGRGLLGHSAPTNRAVLRAGFSLLLGGLAIGALRPINTWDYPTYLALGAIALAYALWRYLPVDASTFRQTRGLAALADLPAWIKRLLLVGGAILALVLFSYLLYQPYTQWYGQGYNKVIDWFGPRTPLSVYFAHWGLFLFAILFWMVWETIHWMAHTPASALRRVDWPTVAVIIVLLLFTILSLAIKVPGIDYNLDNFLGNVPVGRGAVITWVAIPLAAWAGVLLLRQNQPDAKRIVLFLIGTALTITVVVELIVLQGDIGRMNTVFKLYLQAWTMLAIAAAAAFAWALSAQEKWHLSWRLVWQIGLAFLVSAAALFPLLGMTAKIKDRMVEGVPLTLDGMDYMRYATYDELGYVMDLSQDHAAIRWMQDNVPGSPVIVEANSGRLYRWYSRFSIYTGLPGVVGWEWHQQQQRALTPPDWVSRRLREIDAFYQSLDPELARQFLQYYNVRYIILGQLEKATYPGSGLEKFAAQDGILWRAVYQDRQTTIYEVLP